MGDLQASSRVSLLPPRGMVQLLQLHLLLLLLAAVSDMLGMLCLTLSHVYPVPFLESIVLYASLSLFLPPPPKGHGAAAAARLAAAGAGSSEWHACHALFDPVPRVPCTLP